MLDDIGYMYMYHLLDAISNWITSPFQGLPRFKAREFHGLLVGPPMRASLISDTKIGDEALKNVNYQTPNVIFHGTFYS